MNPFAAFIAHIRARRARREHARLIRRREVIARQINERRAAHKAWRYLDGELRSCTRAILECELTMSRKVGL